MKINRYHFEMWIVFSIIFTFAALGLELIEGYKITTTAFYGLKNAGPVLVLYYFTFYMMLYPVSVLPLTLIVNRYIKRSNQILKSIVYIIGGGLFGAWFFDKVYGHADGSFIRGYNLNISTSIILFSIAGLLYFLVDYKLKNKND